MKHFNLLPIFAASYNCGAYGAGNFDEGTACGTQTTPTSPSNGTLTNTGMDVYLPLGIGIVLIVAAIAVIITSIKKHRSNNR